MFHFSCQKLSRFIYVTPTDIISFMKIFSSPSKSGTVVVSNNSLKPHKDHDPLSVYSTLLRPVCITMFHVCLMTLLPCILFYLSLSCCVILLLCVVQMSVLLLHRFTLLPQLPSFALFQQPVSLSLTPTCLLRIPTSIPSPTVSDSG